MRLNKYDKKAFVRAVMQDIPQSWPKDQQGVAA